MVTKKAQTYWFLLSAGLVDTNGRDAKDIGECPVHDWSIASTNTAY